jgi:uncharacterized membrane protein
MSDEGSRPSILKAAEGSIVVNAPVADVYQRWLRFEDYPKFITVIKRVRKLDTKHFVATLRFNRKQYEAALEMVLHVPERRVAWRTFANQGPPNNFATAVVSFGMLSDQSTRVTLKLASSFGGAVSSRIEKYLHNFKRLIERETPSQTNL